MRHLSEMAVFGSHWQLTCRQHVFANLLACALKNVTNDLSADHCMKGESLPQITVGRIHILPLKYFHSLGNV